MEDRKATDVDNFKRYVDLTVPEVIDLTDDFMDIETMNAKSETAHLTAGNLASLSYRFGGIVQSFAKRKRLQLHPTPSLSTPFRETKASSAKQIDILSYEYKRDFIDLGDVDDDPEPEKPGPSKKQKQGEDEESDSDDDYDSHHAGYEMNTSNTWKALPEKKQDLREVEKLDTDIAMKVEELSLDPPDRVKRTKHPMISKQRPATFLGHTAAVQNTIIPWKDLYTSTNIPYWLRPPSHHKAKLENPRNTSNFAQYLEQNPNLKSQRLSVTESFKRSPGSITRIVQQQDWAVICSACVGGQPDSEDEGSDACNRDGTLIVWHTSAHILAGHYRRENIKHYAVNDVKFDPCSTSFVTSGNDRKVCCWTRDPDTEEYSRSRVIGPYSRAPYELAFKPGTATLAVAEKRIHVYRDYESSVTHTSFMVSPSAADHSVGSMIWGTEATDHYIFASTEPRADDCFDGYHKAFNVARGVCDYELDSHEAGDSLAIGPHGSVLIHTSRGAGGTSLLRVYDIKRKNGCAIERVQQEPSRLDSDGEINGISLSPDGLYIALARNDNRTHVYDARMLKKGKLFEYEHKGISLTSPGYSSYGVTKAQWAESSEGRLTLITGGSDGCIRAWDPLQAMESPRNGRVLVQANSDIGYFSLGDRTKNEQQLIVGDCSGEVYIFDCKQQFFTPVGH
ncbi:hypothetical protein AX17_002721 [Amanita inopinata Kibby_2008]|nr:hypothetical protein AX17_002721 [Amanita inopinata Kibby_2008]